MAWVGIEQSKSKNRICKYCRKHFKVGESLLNIYASGTNFSTSINICGECLMILGEKVLYLNCKED
jgi:hypothetical protein